MAEQNQKTAKALRGLLFYGWLTASQSPLLSQTAFSHLERYLDSFLLPAVLVTQPLPTTPPRYLVESQPMLSASTDRYTGVLFPSAQQKQEDQKPTQYPSKQNSLNYQ